MSAFIDQERERFVVELICRTLGVSQSAYYERRGGQRSARAVEDERLLARIEELHEANYCAYGYRRMWKALRRAGEDVGRDRVRIVGWQFAGHMRTDLVRDALRMALTRRAAGADLALVHHSDAGSQYTSHDFAQVLDDHGVLASIGSVGDAVDTQSRFPLSMSSRSV